MKEHMFDGWAWEPLPYVPDIEEMNATERWQYLWGYHDAAVGDLSWTDDGVDGERMLGALDYMFRVHAFMGCREMLGSMGAPKGVVDATLAVTEERYR